MALWNSILVLKCLPVEFLLFEKDKPLFLQAPFIKYCVVDSQTYLFFYFIFLMLIFETERDRDRV